MSIFDNTNNPGNLTAPGGALLYPGQTGAYTSGNGFTYAVFGSVSDGYNALVDYVQRHIAAYPTPAAFVQHYLGTSTPNSANANPAGYAASLSGAFSSGSPQAIATAISNAEGKQNGAAVAGLGTTATPGTALGGFGDLLSNALTGAEYTFQNGIGAGLNAAVNPNSITQAGAAKATAAANKDKTALDPLPWLKTGGLIVLGIIVVSIALFLLARGGKSLAS